MRVGLKHKIILAILGVGALPLVLGMVVAYSQGTTELERVIGGNFRALAGGEPRLRRSSYGDPLDRLRPLTIG